MNFSRNRSTPALLTLRDIVLRDSEIVKALGAREIEKVFDYNYHVKHVGTLFKRVGL